MKILSRSDMLLTVWILNTFESVDFSPYMQNLVTNGIFLFFFSFFEFCLFVFFFKEQYKYHVGIATHCKLVAEKQLCKGGRVKESGGQGKNVMVGNFVKHTLEGKSRQPDSCAIGKGKPPQAGTSDCSGLPAAPSTQAAELFLPTLRSRET